LAAPPANSGIGAVVFLATIKRNSPHRLTHPPSAAASRRIDALFGSFEADGHTIFFKIDYFDPTLTAHSPIRPTQP
jgi:hypothetical protein